jgi:SulP family sulfate permease
VLLALFLGSHSLAVIYMLPMAALGVLLIFAGVQLTLTLLDMQTRKDLFVPILVLGITLASNLAAGFLTGIAVAYILRWKRLSV